MKHGPLAIRVFGALLFLSLAASTSPRLIGLVNDAITLYPMRYEARREHQMGEWYTSIETLRRELPRHELIALISSPQDRDSAVFANYYLYPIRTRSVGTRSDYRSTAADPTQPKTLVAVGASRAERVAYDVLRNRDLRSGRRVVRQPQLSAPASSFVLPLVASLDGAAPATFVTEATITNPNSLPAEVRAVFWPKGMVRTITIPPGATVEYYDFLHQVFDTLDRGWLRLDSSQPLQAAFYFANRGGGDSTLLPNATTTATYIPAAQLYRDSKLFLVNASDGRATAVVDSESIPIDPHAFIVRPTTTIPVVEGNVFAFVTTRELNGRTDFYWPSR
jgi:hypothetical protein